MNLLNSLLVFYLSIFGVDGWIVWWFAWRWVGFNEVGMVKGSVFMRPERRGWWRFLRVFEGEGAACLLFKKVKASAGSEVNAGTSFFLLKSVFFC
ncbi:MAG: hypothetical protein JJU20_00550 [Opitutales bacterium]|nr:hypothetical protein [Opitutales bacterium]